MTIKKHIAKPEHEVAFQDLQSLMSRHADKVSGVELLAIAANMLGKLIAFQDQRKVTPAEAMEIVIANLQVGNQQAIDFELSKTKGNA